MWKLKAVREKMRSMGGVDSGARRIYARGIAVFRSVSLVPLEELAESVVMDPPEDLDLQAVFGDSARTELETFVDEFTQAETSGDA